MHTRYIWLILAAVSFCLCLNAQPVFSTKQFIQDWVVYSDLKNDHRFYYAPGKLQLAQRADGQPAFRFLSLRYTGATRSSDQGEKRFVNQLEFTLEMKSLARSTFQTIRGQLGGDDIDLQPFPIQHMEVSLFGPSGLATEAGASYRQLGEAEHYASGSEAKSGAGDTYWTNRSYTLHLDNHEAQLLLEQAEKGLLTLSIAYSLYGQGVPGDIDRSIEVSGDSSLVEQFLRQLPPESEDPADQQLVRRSLVSDAFTLDVHQWPELIQRVDVDAAEWLAAYPTLLVQCYDFRDQLRPDLFAKKLEIRATGAGGGMLEMEIRFLSSQPDQAGHQMHFQRAVRLSEPISYRIVEMSRSGEQRYSPWLSHNAWGKPLDISTPASELPFASASIEVEIDPESLRDLEIEGMGIEIIYEVRGQPQREAIFINAEASLPIRSVQFRHDRESPVRYYKKWKKNGLTYRQRERVLQDQYLFLLPPREAAE